jgi:histidyl-tRNA synthetase
VSESPSKAPERRKFQAIKGTRDLLPPETALWNRVEQTAHEVFATFGYGEIRLPVFEPMELFARAVGMETDIVGKEMFILGTEHDNETSADLDSQKQILGLITVSSSNEVSVQGFLKRLVKFLNEYQIALKSGLVYQYEHANVGVGYLKQAIEHFEGVVYSPRDAQWQELFDSALGLCRLHVRNILIVPTNALRPEATASVCRAYIENNLQQLPQPVKLYYIGPMFRRERPQKGRYRQFYQIGAEVLGGSDAPAIDAELIEMLMTFFDKIGLQGATLYINSIGHSADNCRRAYVELLRAELQKVKDKLGADSQRRIDTNPLRVLDSKLEHEQAIIETLPHIADHLCADCAANYATVKSELELRGVIYKENWRLVRGLDYYMRTTFEITAQGLGSQNAVCGGGRYDGLVELLGGPPTKGIGFAIGEDRLILSLQEASGGEAPVAGRQAPLLYIAWMGEKAYATAVRAAKDLRNAGFSVELPPAAQKFGKAIGQADRLGAKYALILGEDEVAEGSWTLKTLADGTQIKLPEPALIEHLREQRDLSS